MCIFCSFFPQAKSDTIEALEKYRGSCEPCFLFFAVSETYFNGMFFATVGIYFLGMNEKIIHWLEKQNKAKKDVIQ